MVSLPDKPALHTYTHSLRSRYSETDKMGYVYYGRYLEYFEAARTEMIRELGIPYRKMEEEGILLPVVHAELAYKSPVHYDEVMRIRVMIYEPPMVRLETFYEVTTEDPSRPHVLGRVTLAFSNAETRRPCRVPSEFLQKLKV
ncbi:MAG: thioesterase family protein [Balneolaceae bacterium]